MKHGKKLLSCALALMLVLAVTVSGAFAAEVTPQVLAAENAVSTAKAALTGESAKNASYLKTYFDVELPAVVSAKEFNAALVKILGSDKVAAEAPFTALEAVKTAVCAADYKEVALSYPKFKTDACLSKNNVGTVDGEYAAYVACAIDAGLINADEAAAAAKNGSVSAEEAVNLLMAVAEANGVARNFIGYSNDPDIATKIAKAWDSYTLFNDDQLDAIGTGIVQSKATTGFNIKKDSYDARFLPELTIQYGHSSIRHAHQLLALLNSEGIVAKVQLEPKVSAYQHMIEWGPIGQPTATSKTVEVAENFYVTYAVEYDMKLEFDNEEDLKAFDNVIESYAKKYDGNPTNAGLIAGSWWQPLYTTTVKMEEPRYFLIYDNTVKANGYSIQSFALPAQVDAVKAAINEVDSTVTVNAVPRYVNAAFYRYLGGDYQ